VTSPSPCDVCVNNQTFGFVAGLTQSLGCSPNIALVGVPLWFHFTFVNTTFSGAGLTIPCELRTLTPGNVQVGPSIFLTAGPGQTSSVDAVWQATATQLNIRYGPATGTGVAQIKHQQADYFCTGAPPGELTVVASFGLQAWALPFTATVGSAGSRLVSIVG
jgi:hypothetical protein